MPSVHAKNTNLWQLPEHALTYLAQADTIPHRAEGEAVLLESLPPRVTRVLDLAEIFDRLAPGGVFCNLEHVASATASLHPQFLERLGIVDEDPSNTLLDVETQLLWLRKLALTMSTATGNGGSLHYWPA